MPATPAVLRCVASSPLKNRSPRSVGRSFVPAWLAACHPSGAFPDPEKRSLSLAKLAPPAVQDIGVYLKCPQPPRQRWNVLPPLGGGQFHFTHERPSRQPHGTILHLMKIVS